MRYRTPLLITFVVIVVVVVALPWGNSRYAWPGDDSSALGTRIDEATPAQCPCNSVLIRPKLAMVLIIDKSSSMAGKLFSTPSPLELAKTGAAAVVEDLGPDDLVGVLAFDQRTQWVSRLQPCKDKSAILNRLRSIGAGGGTKMCPALLEAYQALEALRGSTLMVKYVILLSDGSSSHGDFPGAVWSMVNARITVSTVTVGNFANEKLMAMIARQTGGRYYRVDHPSRIPRIITYAYKVGREELSGKLAKRKEIYDEEEFPFPRGFLQIAKLRHNGDWDFAPQAVANLIASLREVAELRVARQQRAIDVLDPKLFDQLLAYMHGGTRFTFTRQEREILAKYLRRGGLLLADACCNSKPFDQAFRDLMAQVFPDRELQPIPLDHELFTIAMGYDLSRVHYSKDLGRREGGPVLEGIEIDGRYVVIYSKYDLGCALQGSEYKGYTHESAIKIASNIVSYALMP